MHILIDSNILISTLIKKGFTRDILTNFNVNFLFPEQGLEEIYFYKSEIIKKSKITEKEFYVLLLRLLKYVRLVPIGIFIGFKDEANKIIGKVDKDDVLFIAAVLALDCAIWSILKNKKSGNIYN